MDESEKLVEHICLKSRERHLHISFSNKKPMQKITFAFPDYDSLWVFKNQTQAINVAISPKKNIISGLFLTQDVELAVGKFNAVTINQNEKNLVEISN